MNHELPDVQAGFRKGRGTRDQIANIHWMGFPHSSVGKESTCNAGDPSSIPGSGRSAGEGIGYPLRVTKSWTRLNDVGQVCLKGVQVSFTFTQAFSQE